MEKIRLQKYMADCGVASRRKCEEMIIDGRVMVNGITVTELGTKVDENDTVLLDGKDLKINTKKVYILLNKPSGYLTTVSDDFGRPTVLDLVKDEIHTRIYPVGRLDLETEGLLIMTNDGDLSYNLTHPKHNFYKTYEVFLNDVPNAGVIERLKKGVIIDGRKTSPAKVDWIRDNILHISIHEGRNRQIRKMAETLGYKVEYLRRISVGNIVLGNLPLGRFRHLNDNEIRYLKGVK